MTKQTVINNNESFILFSDKYDEISSTKKIRFGAINSMAFPQKVTIPYRN